MNLNAKLTARETKLRDDQSSGPGRTREREARKGENATGDGNLLRHVANRIERRKDATAHEHLLAAAHTCTNIYGDMQLGGSETL